jgi:predicted transcriptional regulator
MFDEADSSGGDLRDFRCRITPETGDVLDALAHVTGDDRAAIARQALHEWALGQIHRSTVILRVRRREGAEPAEQGAKA